MAKKVSAAEAVKVAAVPVVSPIQQKFQTTRKELNDAFIEREDEVELVLTAVIANEHVVLVGPPGAGKTMMAEALAKWVNGKTFFILMTKFTQMEEIYGPLDLVALNNSHYRRVTTGRLPEADVAILDEIWKSSSAILNTTLRCLNEGIFENDGQLVKIPLLFTLAASNEWPGDTEGGKELSALMDRFLFRKNIKAIASPSGKKKLLWVRDHTPQLTTSITRSEILQARAEAAQLPWQQNSMDILERILVELAQQGIIPGDRRKYKAVLAAQANAYLGGATQVEPEHLEILKHVLWNDPVEHPDKCGQIVSKLANPLGTQVMQYLLEAKGITENLDQSDLPVVVKEVKKLQEIHAKLNNMKASDRQAAALDYVESSIKEIRTNMAQRL